MAESVGIAAAVQAARDYVVRAQSAAEGIPGDELREGLSRLAAELLVDLPG